MHSDCLIEFEENILKSVTKEEFMAKMEIEVESKKSKSNFKDFDMWKYETLQKKMKKFT